MEFSIRFAEFPQRELPSDRPAAFVCAVGGRTRSEQMLNTAKHLLNRGIVGIACIYTMEFVNAQHIRLRDRMGHGFTIELTCDSRRGSINPDGQGATAKAKPCRGSDRVG